MTGSVLRAFRHFYIIHLPVRNITCLRGCRKVSPLGHRWHMSKSWVRQLKGISRKPPSYSSFDENIWITPSCNCPTLGIQIQRTRLAKYTGLWFSFWLMILGLEQTQPMQGKLNKIKLKIQMDHKCVLGDIRCGRGLIFESIVCSPNYIGLVNKTVWLGGNFAQRKWFLKGPFCRGPCLIPRSN